MRAWLRRGAFGERNFRLLWLGQATSALGDRIAPVALAFAVLDLTGSATDLGYVLAAQAFPMLALVLLGGVWADRLPRQLVMLVSDLARAGVQALLAALLLTGSARVWELVALAALFGAADAFFTPAAVGLTPLTVAPEQLQEANALRGLAYSTTAILGPAFAGVIVAAISPGWALAVDACTFLVSSATLALLRLPARPAAQAGGSLTAELRDGWREVRARRWLWVSITYWGLFNLTAFPAYRVLGPYVAQRSLGGAGAWATILTVGGVGSLLGGVIGLRTRPARPLRACIALMLLWWPPLLCLAFGAPLAATAASSFVAFCGMGWGGSLWPTILQENVPAAAISRVSAFDYLGTFAVSPLGYAVVGILGAGLGVTATLAAAALLGLAATLATLAVEGVRVLPRAAAPAAP